MLPFFQNPIFKASEKIMVELKLDGLGITSLMGMRELSRTQFEEVDLRDNALWCFEHFGTQKHFSLSGVAEKNKKHYLLNW